MHGLRTIHPLLSETALSNLYTMGLTSQKDPRQAIPEGYTLPNYETRLLRAKLILEEALETIESLGFSVCEKAEEERFVVRNLALQPGSDGDLETLIDGCCDLNYVAVGTLMSCGVCDIPHQNLVNEKNNAKFPNGEVLTRDDGKFLKPAGWTPPVHTQKAFGEIFASDALLLLHPVTHMKDACQAYSHDAVLAVSTFKE